VNENNQARDEVDLALYAENRCKIPPDDLLPYAGLFVAWSPDGTRILASAESLEALDQKLEEAGIHFSQVVHDYIDAL
jgi:hypothetical protein